MQPPPPAADLLQELESFAMAVSLVEPHPDRGWDWRPDPTAWSLGEVMCHLRDVEKEVHALRYRTIISQDNPFLSGVASDEWAEVRCYYLQNGPEAREAFLAMRYHNIAFLHNLDEDTWLRMGRHAFLGPTNLQELVYLAVQHDEVHLQQIKDLIGQ